MSLSEKIELWKKLTVIINDDDTTDHDRCPQCQDQILMCECQYQTAQNIVEQLSNQGMLDSLITIDKMPTFEEIVEMISKRVNNQGDNHPETKVFVHMVEKESGISKDELQTIVNKLNSDGRYRPVEIVGDSNSSAIGFIEAELYEEVDLPSIEDQWEKNTHPIATTIKDVLNDWNSASSSNLYTVEVGDGGDPFTVFIDLGNGDSQED